MLMFLAMDYLDDSKREKGRRPPVCRTGKDEMNLLEHSFSGASTRADKSINEVVFKRMQRDPVTNLPVARRLNMSFSSRFGRPTIEDDEVYVGFQAITHQRLQAGLGSPRIEYTRYELVKTIGWPDSGPSYAKVDQAINRLGGVWIVFDNAFYDRKAASWVDVKFHIIDESHLFTREKYDLARRTTGEKRPRSWIRWGKPIFKSFSDGYLATFDLEVYRAIKGGVAKKFFRYSNKRLWQKNRYVIDLRELAEEKLGFKRGQYISELTRMLAPTFDELSRFGFVVKLERDRNSTKAHVCRATRAAKERKEQTQELPRLEKELVNRGVDKVGKKSAAKLVAARSAAHISEQMENYDDRLAHGEVLTPGWLVAAIENEKGFGFRKGYKSKAQRRAEAEARREGERQKAAEKKRQQEEQEEQGQRERESKERFTRFRESFSEVEQIELEDEALSKCEALIRTLVLTARRNGGVGIFHRILWEQHIMPQETELCSKLSVGSTAD